MSRIDEAISDALGIQQDIKQDIIDPKPVPGTSVMMP